MTHTILVIVYAAVLIVGTAVLLWRAWPLVRNIGTTIWAMLCDAWEAIRR
jgi:hypothetical protein